jgi:glutamine synthetase
LPHERVDAAGAVRRCDVLGTWLPANLLRTYLSVKRAELAEVAELPLDDLYERYAHAY